MHFSVECFARGWTVTELPNPLLSVGGLWHGCARLWGALKEEGQVFSLSYDIDIGQWSARSRLGVAGSRLSISARDQSGLHQFGKTVAGEKLERRHSDGRSGRFGKVGSIRNFSSKNQEVLKRQEDDEFIFPVAGGTANLSGRDFEFREPTPRREQTVRSEDLSGELQGDTEEPQPTESRDDAEVRREFWSIQGDFIYRQTQ